MAACYGFQRLNRLRKNAVSDLQGLKPLMKAQTLCRAYPSFVGMKRHDPQNLRVFPQPVKPTFRSARFGRADGSTTLTTRARPSEISRDTARGATNSRISGTKT